MPKRSEPGNAIFHLLDDLLARRRHLEHENPPAERMQMRCGHLIGGILVDFASPSDRRFVPPEPERERMISWAAIRRRDAGERALTMVKRARERLILLLTVHLSMSPTEINQLNLAQVT
jgi:hypothetical protein